MREPIPGVRRHRACLGQLSPHSALAVEHDIVPLERLSVFSTNAPMAVILSAAKDLGTSVPP